jgi:hypothetical protein
MQWLASCAHSSRNALSKCSRQYRLSRALIRPYGSCVASQTRRPGFAVRLERNVKLSSSLSFCVGSSLHPAYISNFRGYSVAVESNESPPSIQFIDSNPPQPVDRPTLDVLKRELKTVVDIYGDFGNGNEHNIESEGKFVGLSGPTALDPNEHVSGTLPIPLSAEIQSLPATEDCSTDAAISAELERMVKNPLTPYKDVYFKYMELSHPRPHRIQYELLVQVVNHLSIRDREQKDPGFASKYLTIINDMLQSEMDVKRFMWDTAMHYISNDAAFITDYEVDSVLALWHKMELSSDTKANHITISIMYLSAVKAGQYALADRLWRELLTRNLKIDRVTRVIQIYAFGHRKDSRRVRKSFLDLVDAGELVDIVVINCVISALVHAGEGAAAEEVFSRVKSLYRSKFHSPSYPNNWREARRVRKLMANGHNMGELSRREAQELSPIAPNETTYRILIRYHIAIRNDFSRAMALLEEMTQADIQPSIPIFNLLFSNFAKPYSGGSSGGNADDLKRLWTRFQEAVTKDPKGGLYQKAMDDRLAITIIEAFARRVSKDAAREVWGTISMLWYPADETAVRVGEILENTLQVSTRKTQQHEITLAFR